VNALAAYHHVAVALRRADSAVVCAHVRPDGDAIGSVLALTLALRSIGVPAIPTLATHGAPVPTTYTFLPGSRLFADVGDLGVPSTFIALDVPNLERLGDAGDLARQAKTLVVLDHHPDAREYGTVNVLDSSASSTSQMIWHLLKALDIPPSPDVALCCYVGLITDTGRFQYDNTTPQSLRDAAEMLDAGVDPADASRLVFQNRTPGSLALEALVMSRLQVANSGLVAWSWLAPADLAETGALAEEAEMLPDAVRLLGGIEAVVLVRETPETTRVGLRAKSGYDVGSVAREFGGGGHRAASGFDWTGSRDELMAALLPKLPGYDAQPAS
jgi:phosphoesterase RecJ-like protein